MLRVVDTCCVCFFPCSALALGPFPAASARTCAARTGILFIREVLLRQAVSFARSSSDDRVRSVRQSQLVVNTERQCHDTGACAVLRSATTSRALGNWPLLLQARYCCEGVAAAAAHRFEEPPPAARFVACGQCASGVTDAPPPPSSRLPLACFEFESVSDAPFIGRPARALPGTAASQSKLPLLRPSWFVIIAFFLAVSSELRAPASTDDAFFTWASTPLPLVWIAALRLPSRAFNGGATGFTTPMASSSIDSTLTSLGS